MFQRLLQRSHHGMVARSMRCITNQGFTLIELMIVVAIIAILASVALPSYRDYVRRGKLPEAFTRLSTYQAKMEDYYQNNRNYGTGACVDVSTPAWATYGTTIKDFNVTCALTNGGQGYTLTATGSGGVNGHTFTLNHQGAQATTYFKGSSVTKTCWLSKGSEC